MSPNAYESERLLGEYLLFHYGRPEEILPYAFGPSAALNFPARAVTECVDFARLPANARALDLGCAVGRSSFELARHCGSVVGIDFSSRFVKAADFLSRHGDMPYHYAVEGTIMASGRAKVPSGVKRDRVKFEVGDA